jgi:hypothetical protein
MAIFYPIFAPWPLPPENGVWAQFCSVKFEFFNIFSGKMGRFWEFFMKKSQKLLCIHANLVELCKKATAVG